MHSIPPIPIDGYRLTSGTEYFYFTNDSNRFFIDNELTRVEKLSKNYLPNEIQEINTAYKKAYEAAQIKHKFKLKHTGDQKERCRLATDLDKDLKVLLQRKEKSLEYANGCALHIEEKIKELQNQLEINQRTKFIFNTTVRSLTKEDGFKFNVVYELPFNKAKKFKEGIETAVLGFAKNTNFIHQTISNRNVEYSDGVRTVRFCHKYNDELATSFIYFTTWLESQINKFADLIPPSVTPPEETLNENMIRGDTLVEELETMIMDEEG